MQSNEFFSLFLDPSMTYSCAIFKVCVVINYLVSLVCSRESKTSATRL